MNKRVYGVLGIAAVMANWNADFTGYPKTTSDGTVFGSDKAFKYPMKKLWENRGEKVLYMKSLKVSQNKKGETTLVPRSLKERYEQLFGVEDLKKTSNTKEVAVNIMTAVDVKQFGATFAEEKNNISITGAVQIGQGFNKYEDTISEELLILSPFRNSSKEKTEGEARNATLGTKIISDEAHYFYPFAINPSAYKELTALEITEGYTEKDYQEFKKTALAAATAYATNSKLGCENEFGLFVETRSDTYLPNLTSYIRFEKGEEMNTIRITCDDLLDQMDEAIERIEVYYNPCTTKIEARLNKANYYHITTFKSVS